MSGIARREAALEAINNNFDRKLDKRSKSIKQESNKLRHEVTELNRKTDEMKSRLLTAVDSFEEFRKEASNRALALMEMAWQWDTSQLSTEDVSRWQAIRDLSQELLERATLTNSAIEEASANKLKKQGAETIAKRHRALLLVDDPVEQALTMYALNERGFDIDVVHTGPRAYFSVMQQDYDVILIDLDLASTDGFDTIEAMRRLPNGVDRCAGLFAITSQSEDGNSHKSKCHQIDAILQKPLDPARLHDVLSTRHADSTSVSA
ncbi:MAG: response regulator [Planctomycetes bacterium]|nr:response regulator [Planctomycetota bacterium]